MSRGAGKDAFSGWMARTRALRLRLTFFSTCRLLSSRPRAPTPFRPGHGLKLPRTTCCRPRFFCRLQSRVSRAQTYLGVMYLRGHVSR